MLRRPDYQQFDVVVIDTKDPQKHHLSGLEGVVLGYAHYPSDDLYHYTVHVFSGEYDEVRVYGADEVRPSGKKISPREYYSYGAN